jgi:hypothetical protein
MIAGLAIAATWFVIGIAAPATVLVKRKRNAAARDILNRKLRMVNKELDRLEDADDASRSFDDDERIAQLRKERSKLSSIVERRHRSLQRMEFLDDDVFPVVLMFAVWACMWYFIAPVWLVKIAYQSLSSRASVWIEERAKHDVELELETSIEKDDSPVKVGSYR